MAATDKRAQSATEADYDRLPYPSLPVAYTQPSHVAAMLQLYGLDAPAVASAHVLELGCASAGNIIPLAARFPDAQFTGIDLSQRHVDEARRRITALGLKNITIERADLTTYAVAPKRFDFIICHGVFSWVPRAAQDAILRLCGDGLSDNGVATISYNVFPGWHLRRVVRDICLFHAETKEAPAKRVAKARAALNDIASSLNGTSPYATLLRTEAQRLAKAPSAYVLGEFLAENNAPCYFSEFSERAKAADLAYVCEGDLESAMPEFFFPSAAKNLRAAGGGDRMALQQHMDFFSGRPFRRSLLVRAGRAASVAEVSPDRLRGLHFAAEITPAARRENRPVFKDNRGRAITPAHPEAARMLKKLADAYPATLSLDELAPAKSQGPALKALFAMLAKGQLTISSEPLKAGSAMDARPRAWALARREASDKQPWATGLNHMAVKLPTDLGALLTLMDGTRDRATLLEAMKGKGDVKQRLVTALTYCSRNGLLEG